MAIDTTHPTYQLLDDFYAAFKRRDAAAMRAAYAEDATFKDAVFTLNGREQIGDMWQMLCERGKDMQLEYEVLEANDTSGRVHWEARYTFSQTGNKVHNIIEGTFTVRDGKIVTHIDDFDFRRWSGQALGLPGKLLGWSGFLQNKVQKNAMSSLEAYSSKQR